MALQRAENIREDGRGNAVGIIDHEFELCLRDGGRVDIRQKRFNVALLCTFRKCDAPDFVVFRPWKILAEEEPLDRLCFADGKIFSVVVEENNVGQILIEGGFPDVNAARIFSAAQFVTKNRDRCAAQVRGVDAC